MAELKTAAQLAKEGYLSSVKYMTIKDKEISEISSDNLTKLTSIVTDRVTINNMSPMSHLTMGAILASVQSEELLLNGMWLGLWTETLVTAMSRVQTVTLEHVTLDPELLAAYDGQGRCTKLELGGDVMRQYRTRLREWAGDRGWRVTWDTWGWLVMEK